MDGSVPKSEFLILDGEASGTVMPVPRGKVIIGSGEQANLQLVFQGVSRVHASLTPMKQRMIISDSASRNGTWVNGKRISVPTEIVDGDLLQFGSVRVLFRQGEVRETVQGHAGNAQVAGALEGTGAEGSGRTDASGGAGETRKESVGAAVLFAVVVNVIGVVGNGLASFFTELTPTWSWFITPVAGLVIAVVTEVIGHYRKSSAPVRARPREQPRPQSDRLPQAPSQRIPPRPQQRRRLLPTLVITVLLLGGGAWLVTAGASYAVGYFSGNEAGVQRLSARVAQEAQGVNVEVQSVQSTAHFTRVEILVRNRTGVSISLPLFHNCALTTADGTTFDADPFRSKWGDEIAAEGQRKGTINFEGQLPQGATAVSLSFSTVYGASTNLPRSITVRDIQLLAMPDSSLRAGAVRWPGGHGVQPTPRIDFGVIPASGRHVLRAGA